MCAGPLSAQPPLLVHSPDAVGSPIGADALTNDKRGGNISYANLITDEARATYATFFVWSIHEKVEVSPVLQAFSSFAIKNKLQ